VKRYLRFYPVLTWTSTQCGLITQRSDHEQLCAGIKLCLFYGKLMSKFRYSNQFMEGVLPSGVPAGKPHPRIGTGDGNSTIGTISPTATTSSWALHSGRNARSVRLTRQMPSSYRHILLSFLNTVSYTCKVTCHLEFSGRLLHSRLGQICKRLNLKTYSLDKLNARDEI
jgi:hypothetical protein